MIIGLPKGLLYAKYHVFTRSFLEELGAELIESPDTNRRILDAGTSCCVDEACLPVKVFHGHVAWLKDKCDAILLPRMLGVREKESICPMFCGLIEMVKCDIPGLPRLIDAPITSVGRAGLSRWADQAGRAVTADKERIRTALEQAELRFWQEKTGFYDRGYPLRVALIGHAYNLYDPFLNMNLKRKLNEIGIGVITAEWVDQEAVAAAAERLFKKPFWTFARAYFGTAVSLAERGEVDGIIYLSSFSCGIDSVVTELIRCEALSVPFLVLKLDEQTGEAGLCTRIEAFSDMLKRRRAYGDHLSSDGECVGRGGRAV